MCPKFICFQLPNVSKYDVNAIRKHLLKSAITKRCKEKRKLQNERGKLEIKIKQLLTRIDFFIFNKALLSNVTCEVHHIIQNHHKKLKKLTKNCILPFDSKESIKNISSHILTLDVHQFGLTHSIVPLMLTK